MILHPGDAAPPASTSSSPPRPPVPEELTRLPRWACWRARTKKCKDKYKDGVRAAERLVYEALHPATGKSLFATRPSAWASYEQAVTPKGRKPFGGVGLLVREDDGLAVLRHVGPEVVAALGASVVHVEQEVDGGGLVAVVKAGVHGAKTNVFVPLSGRKPCGEASVAAAGACPDGEGTESGRKLDDEGLSGRSPYQETGPCPDGDRTVFSSSRLNHYSEGEEDQTRTAVDAYAQVVNDNGAADEPGKWVYGLITVLRSRGLTPHDLNENFLLRFAAVVGQDAGAVQRLVLARWNTWERHKVSLVDALRVVLADPSLLTGLPVGVGDRVTLLAAGVCRFLGADRHPFALSGRVLADVLGLPGQQQGSDVVGALLTLGLIRRVKVASYATKLAAEYVWVAAEKPVEPEPAPAPPPPPARSSRPGHSPERTEECRWRSRVGGFLTPEHYFAEMMVARRLARDDRELPLDFWSMDRGKEYARQVDAARSLLKSFSPAAVIRALQSKDGKRAYTLAASFVREMVRAEQARLDAREAANRVKARAEALAELPPAPDPVPTSTQPPPKFVRANLYSKLMEF